LLVKTFTKPIDLLKLHRENATQFPFLLESAAHGHTWTLGKNQDFVNLENLNGRFSILFAYPQETLVLDEQLNLSYSDEIKTDNFLDALDEIFQVNRQNQEREEIEKCIAHLPFRGGWFLYLGYELAQQIEPSLDLPLAQEASLPTAFATRIPAAVIVDHDLNSTTLIAESDFAHFDEFVQYIECINNKDIINPDRIELLVKDLSEEDPQIYMDAIKRTHEYIRDGDIFQANLSRLWTAEVNSSIADIYTKLRQANPGPFAGLIRYYDDVNDIEYAVISSSPERLVSVNKQTVNVRPIAGTRARDHENKEHDDEIMRHELIKHPKERAEHVMLIDLGRNDLGRICEYGSVQVDELMVIETYQHVHHIVSNITGKTHAEVTPGEVIKAVFPGGTITGCPKVRCMEIIAELEQTPREAYTGSMGYLNHNGDLDLNILIRTMQMKNTAKQRQLKFRAGGGIVYDSDAEKEVNETRAKARGLVKALQK